METLCINKCGDCGINGGEGIIRQLASNLQGWPGNRTRIRRGLTRPGAGQCWQLDQSWHVRSRKKLPGSSTINALGQKSDQTSRFTNLLSTAARL